MLSEGTCLVFAVLNESSLQWSNLYNIFLINHIYHNCVFISNLSEDDQLKILFHSKTCFETAFVIGIYSTDTGKSKIHSYLQRCGTYLFRRRSAPIAIRIRSYISTACGRHGTPASHQFLPVVPPLPPVAANKSCVSLPQCLHDVTQLGDLPRIHPNKPQTENVKLIIISLLGNQK